MARIFRDGFSFRRHGRTVVAILYRASGRPGLSLPIEIRPDVGTTPAAALPNEPRFKIG